MSPRPLRIRKVSNPPIISGLKPYGNKSAHGKTEVVFLQYEEYEAIRLCDFEMLNHLEASVKMNVSRPTVTRIYAQARYKIADAIVTGKQIIIEGGKVYFDSEWYVCSSCGCFFNHPEKQDTVTNCPLCGSSQISNCDQIPDDSMDTKPQCDDGCICLACGYEETHQSGNPCVNTICPQCNEPMRRKNSPHSRKFKSTL
jgi:uncharacterized protein